MKCEEIKILLPEFIDRKLDKDTELKVAEHLKGCVDCRGFHSGLSSFLGFVGSCPEISPPQGMKDEFMQLLEGEEIPQQKKIMYIPGWIKVAAVVFFALGTFTAGYFMGTGNRRTAQLQLEVNSMKKEVLLAGLKDYSGPQKIEAVYSIKALGDADRTMIDALVYTMNSDNNVNVRLAAINALSGIMDKEPGIKNELIRSLSLQDNPLLQISIIQVLTESGVKEAKDEIESLSNNEGTNEEVRKYAKDMIKTII